MNTQNGKAILTLLALIILAHSVYAGTTFWDDGDITLYKNVGDAIPPSGGGGSYTLQQPSIPKCDAGYYYTPDGVCGKCDGQIINYTTYQGCLCPDNTTLNYTTGTCEATPKKPLIDFTRRDTQILILVATAIVLVAMIFLVKKWREYE